MSTAARGHPKTKATMANYVANQTALSEHIRGLREAKAAFQRLPEVFRDRLLAATETTVQQIARGAQARLRSSPAIRTRALHDHVVWSVTASNGRGRVGVSQGSTIINGIKVRGIVKAGKGGSALTSQGATHANPARYAHLVEFGTRRMRAEPFMLPATEDEQPHYLARCMAAGKEAERDLAQSARTI
jgi:HK97 gp10 family phage protein